MQNCFFWVVDKNNTEISDQDQIRAYKKSLTIDVAKSTAIIGASMFALIAVNKMYNDPR